MVSVDMTCDGLTTVVSVDMTCDGLPTVVSADMTCDGLTTVVSVDMTCDPRNCFHTHSSNTAAPINGKVCWHFGN